MPNSASGYMFSTGFDIARPLITLGMNHTEFSGFIHANLNKYWGSSLNVGMERISFRHIHENVSGSSSSYYHTISLDLKIIPQFWLSAYIISSRVQDNYQATLGSTNFYPVTRNFKYEYKSIGLAGRMTYMEVLTDRIEAQIFMDTGIMLDVDNGAYLSQSTPGFIIGAGRAIYMGAGINIGYRFFKSASDVKEYIN